jgi:hypothetical protein
MNTEQTKPAICCRSGIAIGLGVAGIVAVGFAIIGVSVAVCAAIGAVVGAAMHDLASGFAWGVTAGLATGSGIIGIMAIGSMAIGSSIMIAVGSIIMALSFRNRH